MREPGLAFERARPSKRLGSWGSSRTRPPQTGLYLSFENCPEMNWTAFSQQGLPRQKELDGQDELDGVLLDELYELDDLDVPVSSAKNRQHSISDRPLLTVCSLLGTRVLMFCLAA